MSNDMIKRSDAIKATWQEPTYTDPLNVLTEVRDRLEAIPSADRPQEWIPCSERLPEVHEEPYYADHEAILHESDYVLTCCKYRKGFVYAIGSVIHDEVCDSYEWSGLYDYAECVIDDTQVLAWMPLPKPYEEVKENE